MVDNSSEKRRRPLEEPPPATPRWVKSFAIVALVLVALFVILHVTGHGLGGHGF